MSDIEWSQLLLQLKVTIESLLSQQPPQNWTLKRLSTCISDLLNHGSKLQDPWSFIQGLNWLQPSLEGCHTPSTENPYWPQNKSMKWIFCAVENRTIAGKLAWLVSDREHLENFFFNWAFLRQGQFSEAALICLRAWEIGKLDLLEEVHPRLCVIPKSTLKFYQSHRRTNSLPISDKRDFDLAVFSSPLPSTSSSRISTPFGVSYGTIPQIVKDRVQPRGMGRSKSLPCLLERKKVEPFRQRTLTIPSRPPAPPPKFDYPQKSPKKPRKSRQPRRRTFMEDGGTSVRPMATGYFPRPHQGQSLASFFSTANFTNALHGELDRENAHFRISEAMISAIEQVKYNEMLRGIRLMGDSDEEAACSRKSRVKRKVGRKDLPPSSSAREVLNSPTDSSSEDSELTSDPDQLALSLLRQFESHSHHLPSASDLEWLVTADDAPQQLLPLPKGFRGGGEDMAWRGTCDWAPPRAQIIFTVHKNFGKQLIEKQNSRCAGCGHLVAPEYTHKLRYCDYLGRYFCTRCNSNQMSIIPGRIITKWDFNKYPVSDFAYKLIDQMSTDPLFYINDLNPSLYKKVSNLDKARVLRIQMGFLASFLNNCRFAQHLQEILSQEPSYYLSEPNLYSLVDFIKIRSGEYLNSIKSIVKAGLAHIDVCDLCQARGFLCELCPSKEVIFPWNVNEVTRCDCCGACFHLKCFRKVTQCPRCLRLSSRQK